MKTNLILAILAALLAIPTTLSLLSERTAFKNPADEPRLFEGFTKDAIAYVRVSKQKLVDGNPQTDEQGQPVVDSATFARKDGNWIVAEGELQGVPVVAGRIDADLLDHVRRIRIDRERLIKAKATPEELEGNDLTEAKALVIDCFDREGKSLAKLLVGKKPGGDRYGEDVVPGVLVRRADGEEIVLYDHDQAQFWQPSTKAEEWIEKKVHQFETAKVKQLTLRNEKGSVALKRERAGKEPSDADKWVVERGPDGVGAVRQQEVQNLLSRFSMLYAQRFQKPLAQLRPEDRAPLGLGDEPVIEIGVVLEDEKSVTLAIGNKIEDKQEFHAIANESSFLLSIGEWDVTPYQRDPKELFDPPAPAPDAPKDGDPPKDGAPPASADPGKQEPPAAEATPPIPPPPGGEKPPKDPKSGDKNG